MDFFKKPVNHREILTISLISFFVFFLTFSFSPTISPFPNNKLITTVLSLPQVVEKSFSAIDNKKSLAALVTPFATQIVASRTTCNAPCPIFFEGWQSAPTSQIAKWEWDFGDGNNGSIGDYDYANRKADGFNAAHVYEKPGTYTVSLKVTAVDENQQEFTDTRTTTITVSPRTGLTYYVDSVNGNDSNSGTSEATALKTLGVALSRGSGYTVLFKRGQTFSIDRQYSLGNGTLIGAYGDSNLAKPIIAYTGARNFEGTGYIFSVGNNSTIQDIKFDGRGNSSFAYQPGRIDTLYLRVDLENFYRGFWSSSTWSRFFLFGLKAVGGTGTFNYVGQSGSRLAMVGNEIDNIGYRDQCLVSTGGCHVNYLESINGAGLIYKNKITRGAYGGHSLRISGRSNNVYVGRNYISGWDTNPDPEWLLIHIGCNNNNDNDCNMNNILLEKNYFGYGETLLNINSANNVTVRNNIFVTQNDSPKFGAIVVGTVHPNVIYDEVPSKNIKIVNNTIIYNSSDQTKPIFTVQGQLLGTGQLPNHENVVFSNNLIKTNLRVPLVPTSLSGQVNTANNIMTGISGTLGLVSEMASGDIRNANYNLIASSPAINIGRWLGVDSAYDFYGFKRVSSPDAGAFEYQGVLPTVCTAGQTQSQACSSNVGECRAGSQVRTCNSGQWSEWGACTGGINPANEICDSKDNNCNGQVDENNSCSTGDIGVTGDLTCAGAMISYWPLDGNSNDSCSRNAGTVSGATIATGKVGNAYSFNGSNSVVLPQSSIPASGDFSISLWFKPTGASGSLIDASITDLKYFVLGYGPSEIRWRFESANDADVQASYGLPAPLSNDWHHLAVVGKWSSRTGHKIYLDGNLVASKDNAPAIDNKPTLTDIRLGLNIERGTNNPFSNFTGLIDEVRIYNRELTMTEISSLYRVAQSIETPPVVTPPCSPQTCAQLNRQCGTVDNGCGQSLNCGSCAANQTCDSGICQNVTVVEPPVTPPVEPPVIENDKCSAGCSYGCICKDGKCKRAIKTIFFGTFWVRCS